MQTPSDIYEDTMRQKHQMIWRSEIDGKRRIISQGDLRFVLNQDVLIVLPFYYDQKTSSVKQMVIVTGIIVNIHYSTVKRKSEIPRETKLRSSPEANSIYTGSREWAKPLIIQTWKDNTEDAIQTIVTSYSIELDEEFILTKDQMTQVYDFSKTIDCLPFKYDLGVNKALIVVDYRYVMGATYSCQKLLGDILRRDCIKITIKDIENHLKKLKLFAGVFVRYSDSDSNRRNSGIVHFVVIDHVCVSPLEIKFVIRCDKQPNKILAISKVFNFDVRIAYDIENYQFFHPLERYIYHIVNKELVDYDPIFDVRNILYDLLIQVHVYTVKKSLSSQEDLEAAVYENKEGDCQILKKTDLQLTIKRGYKFTGVCLGSYVKGLAYPEGQRPQQHDSYIFFHSKDYYSLVLDPESSNFMTFCLCETYTEYKDPRPNDTILAIPFVCSRETFKGKVNLNWFYPTNGFRLLHMYIINEGKHSYFRGKSVKTISEEIKEDDEMALQILNLYIFGITKDNPTLRTKFTEMFITRNFWWEGFEEKASPINERNEKSIKIKSNSGSSSDKENEEEEDNILE